MDLRTAENGEIYLKVTGGRYDVAGQVFSDRTGYSNFGIRKGLRVLFHLQVSANEPISLLVCLETRTYRL